MTEQHAAVGQGNFQLVRAHGAFSPGLDTDALFVERRSGGILNRFVKAGQAIDRGFPARERGIGADEPGQGFLHPAKGRGGLHQIAELNLAAKKTRGGHYERKDHRQLVVHRGEPAEPLAVVHEAAKIADHECKARKQAPALIGFAAIKCHAFGVFAQTHQAIAHVGLIALLLIVERD